MSMMLVRGSASHIPLADESVQGVVTSPPYWGLRQYAGEQREVWGGDAGCAHGFAMETFGRTDDPHASSTLVGTTDTQASTRFTSERGFCACGAWYGALGLEPTPELYVEHMVAVFREVRRVLRKDGTLWLNLGDSYAAGAMSGSKGPNSSTGHHRAQHEQAGAVRKPPAGMKPKDLVGIPWMVAFALRADGWYLRSDIIWHKPNPMPESVTDRPTKSHEYLFLLTKSERYYYDADAIREARVRTWDASNGGNLKVGGKRQVGANEEHAHGGDYPLPNEAGRNKRTVWTIATRPYPGAHFATFPEQLVEPCIIAGSARQACGVCGSPWERVTERGAVDAAQVESRWGRTREADPRDAREAGATTAHQSSVSPQTTGWQPTCVHQDGTGASVILDPFNGSGTTGRVAIKHGRDYIGVDISHEYLVEQAKKRLDRIQTTLPLGEAAL